MKLSKIICLVAIAVFLPGALPRLALAAPMEFDP